jgi:hypothetical protein
VSPSVKLRFTGLIAALVVLALLTDRASPGFPLAKVGTAVSRVIHETLRPAPAPAKPAARAVPAVARASGFALADIPSGYLGLYLRAASTCPGLSWQVLAGIGKVETDHGRTPAPGVHTGVNAFGCCAGPMQFNIRNGPPSTWDTYGDGHPTHVYQPQYAIPAAAHKLCSDGLASPQAAGPDPCPTVLGSPAQHRAIMAYNHACWYAHQVLALAARYTTTRPLPADPFTRALAHNPHLETTSAHGCRPAADLANPALDLRIQSLLTVLAARWTLRISCLHSGHSRLVKGTGRTSNHSLWRAVDIDQVDHQPVGPHSPATRALVGWLDRLQGPLRPAEVGSPILVGHRPYFTNEDHQHHIHIGYTTL